MDDTGAFQRKLVAGFATTILAIVLVSALAVLQIQRVIRSKDRVTRQYGQFLIDVEQLDDLADRMVATGRGLIILRDDEARQRFNRARRDFDRGLDVARTKMTSPEARALINETAAAAVEYEAAFNDILKKNGRRPLAELVRYFEAQIQPRHDHLDESLRIFEASFRAGLDRAEHDADRTSRQVILLVSIVSSVGIALAIILAWQLTRTLTQLYRNEQRARSAREEILAMVSHDLRGPLTSVQLGTGLLTRQLKASGLPPERSVSMSSVLDALMRTTDRMNRLLQDLVDLARMEAGKFPLEIQAVDMGSLLQGVLGIFTPLANEKGVRLEARAEPNRLAVQVDTHRMHQAISNLVSNAIKFTPRGGAVRIIAHDTGECMELIVSDEGRGIPSDQIPHIFDRYHQTRLADRKRGSGLGLYIVKGIVEAHGGTICVTSRLGSGTRFTIELPKHAAVGLRREPPGPAAKSETEKETRTS